MDFSNLGLYFPTEFGGYDGEMFHYSVHFAEPLTEQKKQEVEEALCGQLEPLNDEEKGIYTGDYFFYDCDEPDLLDIELDLGNCRGPYGFEDKVINGVLLALNNVPGITKVIVNEGCDEYYDM